VRSPATVGSAARATPEKFSLLADLSALAVIAIGLVIQIAPMRHRYLNPDEALHVSVASAPDLIDVYRLSTTTAHPPLFFLLLHAWMGLGRSEFFLRLLPLAFGGVFLWFAYRWAGGVFGKAAGFLTLVVIAFSPMWLPLSSEVRGYTLLLMLTAAALVQLEKALETRSPGRMALSSLLLCLAVLTHYSALFVAPSMALYALVRLGAGRALRSVVLAWAGSQAAVAALCLFLYFTQVKSLLRSDQERQAVTVWLGGGYFHTEQGSVTSFLARQTAEIFRNFFGSFPASTVALFLAVTGLVLLAVKRRFGAVLLLLPWLFGSAAGLLRLYPFGGTRHSAYLLLFLSAAIGVALSGLLAGRVWAALLTSLVLVPFYWTRPQGDPATRSLSQMNAAMGYLRRRAPPGSLLLTDYGTGAVLRYYLGVDGSRTERSADNYRIVRSPMWAPDPKRFGGEIERVIRMYRLSAGQGLWVVRLDSGHEADLELTRRLPPSLVSESHQFGDVSIIDVLLRCPSDEDAHER
jgi:Dolichyl-phosphate-mannose-protein mannosyltransferase